jgi:hypothetical protein
MSRSKGALVRLAVFAVLLAAALVAARGGFESASFLDW